MSELHEPLRLAHLGPHVLKDGVVLVALDLHSFSRETGGDPVESLSDVLPVLEQDAVDGLVELVVLEVEERLLHLDHVRQYGPTGGSEDEPLEALGVLRVDGSGDGVQSDILVKKSVNGLCGEGGVDASD